MSDSKKKKAEEFSAEPFDFTAKEVVFDPPDEGIHEAVFVDIVDMGVQTYKDNPPTQRIALVWQLEDMVPDVEPEQHHVVHMWCSPSFGKKSNLRKALDGMVSGGIDPKDARKGIRPVEYLGTRCCLVIKHQASADGSKVYANIDAVTVSKTKKKPWDTSTYVRPPYLQKKEDSAEITD